jgi:putative transposase
VRVAIDDHRVGYFGVANRDTTRAEEAGGTHTFHTYATACVVGGPARYTPGLTAVGDKEPMAAVLTRLLGQVIAAGVTAQSVLRDETLFAVAVMRLLPSRNLSLVIPAVVRGRKPRHGGSGGADGGLPPTLTDPGGNHQNPTANLKLLDSVWGRVQHERGGIVRGQRPGS